jgi:4-alpha-glucanotransferase
LRKAVVDTIATDLLQIRGSGILLHPTSLPSPYGIGDLGQEARKWVDGLAGMRQRFWQMLPLGPTGYADSPYQCLSAFANNPLLISPDDLARDGLLEEQDVAAAQSPLGPVDYGAVIPAKTALLARAWQRFQAGAGGSLQTEFESYCRNESAWLDDFGLYMTIKETQGLRSWQDWPADLRLRDPRAMQAVADARGGDVRRHKFLQFLFYRQWTALREYARGRGVRLIGDMPLFIALDSADVWSRPEYFLLDKDRRPLSVAGVPPDYFSATGQLWGNPLYDWAALRKDNYSWWAQRMKACIRMADIVRVDHFRGFEAAYQIPAGAPTAGHGKWVKGPGGHFFDSLRTQLGPLPVIAEDLGVITPAVHKLRTQNCFPGMRILQFAFDDPSPSNPYLPHNYESDTVVYTGTHDNDTLLGWFAALGQPQREFLERYLAGGEPIGWRMIRAAWASVAHLAVVPLPDILGLGAEARMNFPGTPDGNWRWRFRPDQLTEDRMQRLAELTRTYGREAEDGR